MKGEGERERQGEIERMIERECSWASVYVVKVLFRNNYREYE